MGNSRGKDTDITEYGVLFYAHCNFPLHAGIKGYPIPLHSINEYNECTRFVELQPKSIGTTGFTMKTTKTKTKQREYIQRALGTD